VCAYVCVCVYVVCVREWVVCGVWCVVCGVCVCVCVCEVTFRSHGTKLIEYFYGTQGRREHFDLRNS